MAIFSGNWKDPAGVPFDAEAFQHSDYGASGSARVRRRRILPNAARVRGAMIRRHLRDRWHYALDDWDRYLWSFVGAYPLARAELYPSQASPFIAYLCFCYGQVWATGATDITTPSTQAEDVHSWHIVRYSVPAQTITCSMVWGYWFETTPNCAIAWYHVDPTRWNNAGWERATRQIHFEADRDLLTSPYQRTVAAAFPLVVGQTLRVFFRQRDGMSHFKEHQETVPII